jgi:hypothetical protein
MNRDEMRRDSVAYRTALELFLALSGDHLPYQSTPMKVRPDDKLSMIISTLISMSRVTSSATRHRLTLPLPIFHGYSLSTDPCHRLDIREFLIRYQGGVIHPLQ